ncbi:MAG: GNAT family N-acetyltransferase [Phycisphaeraceae bacterium]|nr:GNAT family N-acetyltransferase [Phycisphaeraceae bacterium]
MSVIEPARVRLRDGAEVLLRTADEADAAELIRHARDVVTTSPHSVTTLEEMAQYEGTREIELIRDHRDSPNKVWIVAEAGPRLVGEISFRANAKQRMAHHGHFGLGVDSDWRGRGLGRVLVGALLDWARVHPAIEKVCLGVFATNINALRLYRSMGFVEEGRRQGEFKMAPGVYEDDIQMSLWVKPRETGTIPSAFGDSPGGRGSARVD